MADSTGHLPRHPSRVLMATKWSLQGLRAAWLHESSFRLEVYLLVVAAPLALWLGGPGSNAPCCWAAACWCWRWNC